MDAYQVIKRPIITEASMAAMEENKYTFDVDTRANKTEVKQAIEKLFDVKVTNVNIMNIKGKAKRMGVHSGYTNKRRKAIVTLTEDSNIEIFDFADTEE